MRLTIVDRQTHIPRHWQIQPDTITGIDGLQRALFSPKLSGEKTMIIEAIMLGRVPLALIALPFVPTSAIETYPYLEGGILLHSGYKVFLLKSYQNGELAQEYPIAR